MKILVTGGAGFIGSSLADHLLKSKNEVIIVDNFSDFYDQGIKENNIRHNLTNSDYSIYRIDIEDKESLENVFKKNNIDIVIHLAARAGVRPSIERPELYVKTNVLGTINILDLMVKFKIKKMIFASSSSIYGNCKEELFSEDLKTIEPISPYAATKLSCEHFCYTYSKLYNINIVCLRFFTVYGPRQRPDLAISKFINLVETGKSIPVYGDGTTKRDYTYIDDIITGIEGAIEYNKTPYEIINLGGGEPVNLNTVIKIIENGLGKKAVIDRQQMQPGDVDKTVSDIKKARDMLNYDPKTKFEVGINKFINWRINSQNLVKAS